MTLDPDGHAPEQLKKLQPGMLSEINLTTGKNFFPLKTSFFLNQTAPDAVSVSESPDYLPFANYSWEKRRCLNVMT